MIEIARYKAGSCAELATELRVVPLLYGRIKRVHVDMNDLANRHLANHFIPGFRPVRAFAYLPGLCFPKERDAKRNASTVGVPTENRSVICRADGVSIGIEAT